MPMSRPQDLGPAPRFDRKLLMIVICGLVLMGNLSHLWADENKLIPTTDQPARKLSTLSSQVLDYLSTSSHQEAEQLLQKIVRHPTVTIEQVESIIQKGRTTFTSQPVGTLYGQPLLVRNQSFRYGLFVPPSYTPENAYSLVICLHGAGFSGDAYLERWSSRLGDKYILACPTIRAGSWWTRLAEEVVLGTIQTVTTRYHIDPDRVFLTGMSNGGIGAWLIGFHNADRFAGLAPMAGGIDDVLFPFLENLRNTPVYILHGTTDNVMPIRLSRTIATRLEALGYSFVFREHQRTHPMAGGHFFPREELPALITWFEQQRRASYPQQVTLVRDASHFHPVHWMRIDATDRIAAFSDNLIDRRDQHIRNKKYAKLDATITDKNQIHITTEHIQRITILLNDHLVDLANPITITLNGIERFRGSIQPSLHTLLREARKRQDPKQLFTALISLSVHEKE